MPTGAQSQAGLAGHEGPQPATDTPCRWRRAPAHCRIAVPERNTRWCSDGFEIACDNGERVRVVFALDCCDREPMGFVGTTGGISGNDVRDLMVTAVEQRFGRVNRLPKPIEGLSDKGSCYVARHTRAFARGSDL